MDDAEVPALPLDSIAKSWLDWTHENKDVVTDSRIVLCSRDSLLCQPIHGHLEAERSQIEVAPGRPKNTMVVYKDAMGAK